MPDIKYVECIGTIQSANITDDTITLKVMDVKGLEHTTNIKLFGLVLGRVISFTIETVDTRIKDKK